jgi:hypothetical protein
LKQKKPALQPAFFGGSDELIFGLYIDGN